MRLLGSLVLLFIGALPGAAQTVTYEGAVSVTTGRYFFDQRTTSLTMSTGASFRSGPWTVQISAPVWLQNTTLVSSTGPGGIPTGGPAGREEVADSGAARHHPGGSPSMGSMAPAHGRVPAPDAAITGYQAALGDPVLRVTNRALEAGPASVSLGIAAKAPMADTAALGTGRWDFGFSAGLALHPGHNTSLALDLSYWHLGDLADFEFNDPVLATLSLGRLFGERWGSLVALAAGTSAVAGFDPPVSAGAALSRLGNRYGLGISVSLGLTETAGDLGVGAMWWVRL